VLDLIPGEGDQWILLASNGVTDPSNNEMPMNDPHPEFIGSFDSASEAMDKRITELIDMGYHKIKHDEN
jgi:hypothetical protein